MRANVTALHPDRTRALVQRPKRRAHVASIGAGDAAWIALCGRYVPAEGASFWIHDAAEQGVQHEADLCQDCAAISELVGWAVGRAIAQAEAEAPRRRPLRAVL